MHSRTRKLIPLAAALSIALFGLASAQSITVASPGTTGAVIDPQRNNTIAGYAVSEMIADTLLLYRDGEYFPALATSWSFDEASLSYRFELRQGVSFQNGAPFDAEAVVFSFERILDPSDPLTAAGILSNVTSVTAVDTHTVDITLDSLNPDFLLNLLQAWIVEPGSAAGGATPVGTGPYRVVEYEPDQRILLAANDDYWGGAPAIREIVVRNIPDPGTLVLELEAGTVDLIMFTPPRDVVRLAAAGYEALPFVAVNSAYLAINNATVDTELRRAICYAIDRDVILDTAYAGLGSPQLTLARDDGWARDFSVPGYVYDPEQAIAILEAAGYVDSNGDGWREKDGVTIDLDFQSRGDGEWLLSTQIIQQFLEDVGLRSTITTSERLTYYEAVRTGGYDIGWFISNALPEPPIMNGIFYSQEFWNVTQTPRDDLDAAILAGRSTVDQDVRAAAYSDLQRIVYEDAIQCPAFWVQQVHVANADVQGILVSAQGILNDPHTWTLRD